MIKLGITGGIGSGKSVVARLLQVMDVPVYLTDDAAKQLMTESSDIRRELSALAGAEVYRPDGSLNRALLAAYMFGHPDRVARVNSIVHPRVKADFLRWCGEQERRGFPLVGMECAILYESGFDSLVDRVLTVSAPVDIRLQRVMRRDAAREELVKLQNGDPENVGLMMCIVRSRTKNYTKFFDTTHLEYLDRAYAAANAEERFAIEKEYEIFCQRRKDAGMNDANKAPKQSVPVLAIIISIIIVVLIFILR